jgi:hypothetical protein
VYQFSSRGIISLAESAKVGTHELIIFHRKISENSQVTKVPVDNPNLGSQKCCCIARITKFLLTERNFITKVKASLTVTPTHDPRNHILQEEAGWRTLMGLLLRLTQTGSSSLSFATVFRRAKQPTSRWIINS